MTFVCPMFLVQLNNMYNAKGHNFSTSVLADKPVDNVIDIPLAQTGEGIAECELLKWFVQEVSHWATSRICTNSSGFVNIVIPKS